MALPIIDWFSATDSMPLPSAKPIHVRIVATYPAEDGLPEETFDLTYRLPAGFAPTPGAAHERIKLMLARGETIEFADVSDPSWPVRFGAEFVARVMVW